MSRYDPEKHHRRSIRLTDYFYASTGAYFVTVCTQNRECVFGQVVDGAVCPNSAGIMIQSVWNEIPLFYPRIELGEFIVMPNHIHAIIHITSATTVVGAGPCACPVPGQPQGVAPTETEGLSLPDIVHRYKTMTTKQYADGVKNSGWSAFPGRLWQRNYYEHIIRNDSEYGSIARYIMENPRNWMKDELWME